MHRHLLTLAFISIIPFVTSGQTWEKTKRIKSADLDLYWETSRPFIYQDENGNLTGIEYELMEAFSVYLKKEHDIEVELNWKKADNFSHILELIRTKSTPNIFGVSALSITDERKSYARFTENYLPDITVLVSSKGTPIVSSYEEINDMMRTMDAVTIRDTKYEMLILELKDQINARFDVMYIESERNILDEIGEASNRFGFIDLPVYLMQIKDGGELTRQNLFTVKGQGYAFILPINSDWDIPMNEFLGSPANQEVISEIISKYLGKELYNFIEDIYTEDQLSTSILTKEKELQLALIKNANLKLEEEQSLKNILITGISTVGIFLLVIGYLFYKNQKTTKLLIGQKDMIYDQQEDIRQKNEQLMNRNAQLMTINEEKNNLVKILAHDIRSPLSQITMIAEILSRPSDEAMEKKDEFLAQIGKSAERINEMVSKILGIDSVEDDKLQVMRERVDVRDILNEIKSRYSSQAVKKEINFKVRPCSSNYIIRTDHLLLTLVIENLVSNALKFSPQKTTVILESECKYDGVLFKVSDEGPGFTEEDKKLLFSRFQKLSAKPTAGESSVGLGLSIVKKYVTDIGGEVWLESEEGKGSTFFVKISV